MKKTTIFLLLIIVVVLSTLVIANIEPMQSKGLIIKLKPLKFAIIFAHGGYIENETSTIHRTVYEYGLIPTYKILNNLKEEGYDKVWISMCETRNYDCLYCKNDVNIYWKDLNMTVYKSRLIGEKWF